MERDRRRLGIAAVGASAGFITAALIVLLWTESGLVTRILLASAAVGFFALAIVPTVLVHRGLQRRRRRPMDS